MSAAQKDGPVRIKVTISREEHPALYETLLSITNPRRRMRRFRDLVIMGLMVELNREAMVSTAHATPGSPELGAAGRDCRDRAGTNVRHVDARMGCCGIVVVEADRSMDDPNDSF
jgi:hypothetical protein